MIRLKEQKLTKRLPQAQAREVKEKEHKGDALALGAEEGRDKLR